jgi:hypothetical protein
LAIKLFEGLPDDCNGESPVCLHVAPVARVAGAVMDEPCSPVIDNNILFGPGLTPAILTALLSNRPTTHRRPLVADH